MKQALITGGAGFIGSHLAEALLAQGNRVRVVDDESTGSTDNLHQARQHFDFEYVRGDAGDRKLLEEQLRDVDEVYHLAAAVGVKTVAEAPIESIERNIGPTQALLAELGEAARSGRQIKLFLASSSEVYGRNPKPRWSEEDDLVFGPTTGARWSYGMSKAIDEMLALGYGRRDGLPVVIGRLFNVVGPRQTGRYGMVLPRLVDRALAGQPPVVYDDGRQVRCFAHVEDVVRAVIGLMDAPQAIGRIFNIGSDQPITILELAERVVAAVDPKLDIEFDSFRLAYGEGFEDVRSRIPDLTRLKQTIDFELEHDLDTIIRDVVESRRA